MNSCSNATYYAVLDGLMTNNIVESPEQWERIKTQAQAITDSLAKAQSAPAPAPAPAPAAATAAPKKTPKEKAAEAHAILNPKPAESTFTCSAESVPIHGERGLSALGISNAKPISRAQFDAALDYEEAEERGSGGKAPKQKKTGSSGSLVYKKPSKAEIKRSKPPGKMNKYAAFIKIQGDKEKEAGKTWECTADRLRDLSAQWRALSEQEQERYVRKAEKLDAKRLAEWEASQRQ